LNANEALSRALVGLRAFVALSTLIRSFLLATAKPLAGFALGSAILRQVAMHSGPQNYTTYVHMTTDRVDVKVDKTTFHVVSRWETPIVCELGPGKHTLQMTRNGKMLYEEEFSSNVGCEVVLTAGERPQGPEQRKFERFGRRSSLCDPLRARPGLPASAEKAAAAE
jgi:hypothetical protein